MNNVDFSNLNAIFVSTRHADEQASAIAKIGEILDKLNIQMLLDERSARLLGLKGLSLDEIFSRTKLVMSLGGDGNYIGSCRRFARRGAFVFGVHTGHLGFLTDVKIAECEEFIKLIKAGDFVCESVRLLQANFFGTSAQSRLAFNDITLLRQKPASTVHLEAFLDDLHFNSYYGDGVIIASAMGSTAYNMSAGGAIIHPSAKVFSLTPVCSHSLSQRPLILPETFRVKFRSNDEVSVLIDGQDSLSLNEFKEVEIFVSEQKIGLIRKKDRNYFRVLKEKLRWGQQ